MQPRIMALTVFFCLTLGLDAPLAGQAPDGEDFDRTYTSEMESDLTVDERIEILTSILRVRRRVIHDDARVHACDVHLFFKRAGDWRERVSADFRTQIVGQVSEDCDPPTRTYFESEADEPEVLWSLMEVEHPIPTYVRIWAMVNVKGHGHVETYEFHRPRAADRQDWVLEEIRVDPHEIIPD